MLVISLWLHLTLLLLMIVTFDRERREEELPPPSTVAMVFEGGQPQGPALPNPQPNVAAPSPPSAPSPPAPVAAVPPPALTVPPQPPPPAPPVAAEPAPLPTPPLPAPPPAASGEVPVPRPPPVAMVVPRPAPAPSRPTPTPAPQAAPEKPSAFPTPMNFSFNQPTPRAAPPTRSTSRAPSTLDFSLAPRQGATDTTPFSRVSGARVGPDWRNQLSAWVRAHAYYPEQAAMNGEDGNAMVQVVANPNGKVTSVELIGRSGSKWLDMALVALFRDANLPPLYGESEPITFNFTMHYILIRMQ